MKGGVGGSGITENLRIFNDFAALVQECAGGVRVAQNHWTSVDSSDSYSFGCGGGGVGSSRIIVNP